MFIKHVLVSRFLFMVVFRYEGLSVGPLSYWTCQVRPPISVKESVCQQFKNTAENVDSDMENHGGRILINFGRILLPACF